MKNDLINECPQCKKICKKTDENWFSCESCGTYYIDSEKLSILLKPTPQGQYRIGESFNISFTKKPMWIHRKIIKLILGWDWIDEKST